MIYSIFSHFLKVFFFLKQNKAKIYLIVVHKMKINTFLRKEESVGRRKEGNSNIFDCLDNEKLEKIVVWAKVTSINLAGYFKK